MEIYTLDDLYRRDQVVDRFESLIWTERYSAYGDFELDLFSNGENRRLFPTGTLIAINRSYRVMEVETIENKIDSEGRAILTVKGRSLEKVLDDRIARPSLADLTTMPKWTLTGLPAALVRQLYHDICALGILDAGDVIPSVIEGSIFPAGTIPEPSTSVTLELEPDTLYKVMKDICDMYDLGFRLVRDFDTSDLYFDVYTGSDRTTQQTDFPAVVFSPDLDNLQNTAELSSIANAKNAAFVISPVGQEMVYPDGVDPAVAGFDRRVILVQADDITDTVPADATAKMIQKGKEELSKHRAFSAFDGELNQNSAYRYGVDYELGDLIEKRNVDGVINRMRVTEQIFVSDKEGERSYPTLAMNQFVMPGEWASWSTNQIWEDLGPEEWEDV